MALRVVVFDTENHVSSSSVTSLVLQGHLLLFVNSGQNGIHLRKMVCYQLAAEDV